MNKHTHNGIVYEDMVRRLAKPGADIIATLTPVKIEMLHMASALLGEIPELFDASSDEDVIEELGDVEFYLEGLYQAIQKFLDFSDAEMVKLTGSVVATKTKYNMLNLRFEILNEVGRIYDVVKKVVVYNNTKANLSLVEIVLQSSLPQLLQSFYTYMDLDRKTVLAHNIEKLSKRYGDSYTDKAAEERKDKAEAV